jgi:hypothetical protein
LAVATRFMALVIFWVDLTEEIRTFRDFKDGIDDPDQEKVRA